MSYFLWIEDFENSPKVTASDVFGSVLDENHFAEDKRQLKRNLTAQGVFIELSFQDGLGFIKQNLGKIDYIILDIDLLAYSKGDEINAEVLQLLADFQDYKKLEDEAEDEALLTKECDNLKKIAGFYLYTELVVELGFPTQHILFCSNHGENTLTIREAFKAAKIALPPIYQKSDSYVKEWVKSRYENPYSQLRRGIIEGCNFLKAHIEKDDDNIQFRDFIKIENHQPTIEIPSTDIKNYLDALSQFLTIKQPNDPNIHYRLFLRTLVHEWEENIDPKSLKEKYANEKNANDLSKIRDIYTFAWLMKMTRNWVSHANLLEPLNPQIMAFLFLVNMRAMFKSPKAIQSYESILLRCISLSPASAINSQELNSCIGDAEHNIDGILAGLNITESGHFGKKINAIYRQNTGNPDAETHDFKSFLLHYFWINQKPDLRSLTANSDDFLPTLARHIYNHSFRQGQ